MSDKEADDATPGGPDGLARAGRALVCHWASLLQLSHGALGPAQATSGEAARKRRVENAWHGIAWQTAEGHPAIFSRASRFLRAAVNGTLERLHSTPPFAFEARVGLRRLLPFQQLEPRVRHRRPLTLPWLRPLSPLQGRCMVVGLRIAKAGYC